MTHFTKSEIKRYRSDNPKIYSEKDLKKFNEFQRKRRIIRKHFGIPEQDVKKPPIDERIGLPVSIGNKRSEQKHKQANIYDKQKRIDRAIESGRAEHV